MSGYAFERRILSMAALVSANEAEALHWYRSDPIAGLGGRTADELVRIGRGAAVLDFLSGVLRHEMRAVPELGGGPW